MKTTGTKINWSFGKFFASVRLFSCVYLQCLLDFWHRKYNEFFHCLLFLNSKSSVKNSMHVSGAIFTSLLSL